MDDFELELRQTFLEEAGEMLSNAEQCFLDLETSKDDPKLIDEIFRLAHSLKGSAKAVGFGSFGDFTHVLESFLLKIQKKEIPVTNQGVSLLLECNDFLTQSVQKLKADPAADLGEGPLLKRLEAVVSGEVILSNEAEIDESSQEPVSEPMDQTNVVPLASKADKPQASADETIRVNLGRIDQLLNSVGELVIMQNVVNENRNHVTSPLLSKTLGQMGKIVRELQSLSMSLRMLPLKGVFQRMQRIVRDTSKALGKEVELELHGEETELDKTVIERLSDPLVHLMRNAVDHGVESPEERTAAGKNPVGRVRLSAFQRANQIVIEIRDDGKGLNKEKILKLAQSRGIVSEGAVLTEDQIHQLIFAPGFSTKEVVTDVSGRGVGMDVVKTNITDLQGHIEIESTPGQGSCFRVLLPMTLAIVDGMVVTVDDSKYIVPLSQVTEFIQADDKTFVEGPSGGEVMNLRGRMYQVYALAELLGNRGKAKSKVRGTVMTVVDAQGGSFAVSVDEVLMQQQVVIKPLGKEINGLPGVVGASILGDGKAAFILDLSELMRTKANSKTPGRPRGVA